ncbi:chorismate synthase [Tissierella sp.]|uniref:chorismate synthase n=1 Tax=Tissierella sp. TaxID=41274 RepID=UPI00285F9B6D|nr:chorismate synthase [Tissierella sp.]MDR7857170.1 chorismate synthase [Tissierella sp.]
MIRFLTGGESHGEKLLGIIDGIPANLFLDIDFINRELKRRQMGYGRSARMEIESDEVIFLSGINENYTTGNPISLSIANRGRNIELVEVTKPRPGHGDLVGALKYNQKGGRNILERASARETAMRVAMGSICKILLKTFNIEIFSHVINIGGVDSNINYYNGLNMEDLRHADQSSIRVIDKTSEEIIIEKIKEAKEEGDTLGGVIEVIVQNVPVGLGSHTNWDTKIDGRLAAAIMGIQGIKGVEFGLGHLAASRKGSEFQDEILFENKYKRKTNNSGGIEAGITNGEDLVIRATMKPIPTLRKPLTTVDMITKEAAIAQFERSDICAVPSASIVAESMIAYILADELLKKIGGDFIEEIKVNFDNYLKYLESR